MRCAVPDVAVRTRAEIRLEVFFELRTHFAIDAIGAHHEIVRTEWREIEHGRAKMEIDAKLAAALLKNMQNLKPCNARKFVAADRYPLIAIDNVHIIPHFEALRDGVVGRLIFNLQVAERLIRKDYAPAERIVRGVTLE